MTIEVRRDVSGVLSLFLGRGRLETREIVDSIVSFYKAEPTPKVLWDLRQASIGHLRAEDILLIRESLLVCSQPRPGVRMAVVTSGKLDYGVVRMGQGYVNDIPLEIMAFREFGAAESWLDQNRPGTDPA